MLECPVVIPILNQNAIFVGSVARQADRSLLIKINSATCNIIPPHALLGASVHRNARGKDGEFADVSGDNFSGQFLFGCIFCFLADFLPESLGKRSQMVKGGKSAFDC
jgi:hypothetical protein